MAPTDNKENKLLFDNIEVRYATLYYFRLKSTSANRQKVYDTIVLYFKVNSL